MHGLGLPGMGLAGTARFVKPANRQHIGATFPSKGMNLFGFILDAADTYTRYTTGHTGEIFRTHRPRQTYGFKVQTAPIRGHHRNTHLGHNL